MPLLLTLNSRSASLDSVEPHPLLSRNAHVYNQYKLFLLSRWGHTCNGWGQCSDISWISKYLRRRENYYRGTPIDPLTPRSWFKSQNWTSIWSICILEEKVTSSQAPSPSQRRTENTNIHTRNEWKAIGRCTRLRARMVVITRCDVQFPKPFD